MQSSEDEALPLLLTKRNICAKVVPVGIRTLERWISTGDFPPPDLRDGRKLVFWRRETVQSWFASYATVKKAA